MDDLWLFRHEFKKEFNDPSILKLRKLIVTGNLYFPKKIYANTLISYHSQSFNYSFFKVLEKIKERKFIIKFKRHFVITDDWGKSYFHWLLDCLPRLILLEELGINARLALPNDFIEQEYVAGSLKLLGKNDIQFIKKDKWYFFSTLWFPVHLAPTGNYNDLIIKKLRKRMVGTLEGTPQLKIYISRSKAGKRKIKNEEEILPLLDQFGFQQVFCEEMSFTEQIKLFRQIKYLVTNHGAGLSNMLFMASGTNVLELRKKDDDHSNCYFSLASGLDLNYYYLKCAPVNEKEDAYTADIIVNTAELAEQIQLMLREE